jgi:hypothetical protein
MSWMFSLLGKTSGNVAEVNASNQLLVLDTSPLAAGAAVVGKVGIDQTTPGTTNGVVVTTPLPAGTNLLGKTGIDQTTPGTTNGVVVTTALPTGANTIGTVGLAAGAATIGTVGITGTVTVTDTATEAALGAPGDGAWASGAGSVIAVLKAIVGFLNSIGTNTAAGAGAQTTGNASLATIVTNTAATTTAQTAGNTSLTAAAAALGAPADVAWASGSGSVVALLKGIYGKFLATQPVSLAALPALTSGAAAIGTVGVTALPALVAGAAIVGKVGIDQTTPGTTNGVVVNAALPAGTNQIGLVTAGGFTNTIQVTPTVQVAAYAAGQCVGALITIAAASRIAAGSGLIQAVTTSFIAGVLPALDVIFFNASPSGSTTTDKTTFAVATADLAKIVGVAHLTDGTLLGATAPSFIQSEQQGMPFKLPSGTSLFASVVTRNAITLTTVADMTLSVSVLQD